MREPLEEENSRGLEVGAARRFFCHAKAMTRKASGCATATRNEVGDLAFRVGDEAERYRDLRRPRAREYTAHVRDSDYHE